MDHVKWVTQCLFKARLYLTLEKPKFHKEMVQYLGLSISTKGNVTDEDKVEPLLNYT